MESIRTYKKHEIRLDTVDGKFVVTISGIWKRFPSLKSAQNAIDKIAVVDFEPREVLIIDTRGFHPSTYFISKVKLTGYKEEQKSYGRGVDRFFTTTKKDERIIIGKYHEEKLFNPKDRAKLEANIKEANEQEKIEAAAADRGGTLEEQREKLAINLDPRPEQDR